MVLSACSTYFEQLFLEHAEPPVTGPMIVIMRETSFDDLAIIVEFMYKGEINVSQVFQFPRKILDLEFFLNNFVVKQDQLGSLLRTAESLRVKGLAQASSGGGGGGNVGDSSVENSLASPQQQPVSLTASSTTPQQKGTPTTTPPQQQQQQQHQSTFSPPPYPVGQAPPPPALLPLFQSAALLSAVTTTNNTATTATVWIEWSINTS